MPGADAATGWRLRSMRLRRGGFELVARCDGCGDYNILTVAPATRVEDLGRELAFMRELFCTCQRALWPHPQWRRLAPGVTVGPADFAGKAMPTRERRIVVGVDLEAEPPVVQLDDDPAWRELGDWTTEWLAGVEEDDDAQ